MAFVLNQSFRDWSSTRKFPFTDSSDMTCQDGRGLPMSLFTMISLIPDIEGTVNVSSIDKEGIHFSIADWTADAVFEDYADGWIPVMRSGNCVGSVMTNTGDLDYLKGMVSVAPMIFTEGHLQLRPEVVKGFCLDTPVLTTPPTFDGYPSQGMTVSYDSDRFIEVQGEMSVDTQPIIENETEPIEGITLGEGANEETYPLAYPGNLVIRTPSWCDTQFIPGEESIVFHQRGS